MSRGRALIVLAVAVVALLVAMAPAEGRMMEAGPGIVPFELAGSEGRAVEILGEWGENGRDAARTQLWIDFPFLLAYGAFLVLAAAATRDLARGRGWRRLAAFGGMAVPLGAVAAGFDALENVCLLLTLDGSVASWEPLMATVFAAAKFALLAIAILYVLAGLAMRLVTRVRPASA